MECRNFQVTVVSAEHLPNIRLWGEMKVYAEVSLNEEPETTMRTNVDTEGGTEPRWNFRFYYTIRELSVRELGLDLVVKLYCRRTLQGDKLLGRVRLPVNSLFEMGIRPENGLINIVEGTRDGTVTILYSFGDMFLVAEPSLWKKLMKAIWNALAVILRGIWVVVTGLAIYVQRRRRAYRIKRVF